MPRLLLLPLLLLLLLPPNTAFFMLSHVPRGSQCNNDTAVDCFTALFDEMPEVCEDRDLTFRCMHYKYLDRCFQDKVGKCRGAAVGKFAITAHKRAREKCDAKIRKQHREIMRSSDGTIRDIKPTESHFMSALGTLQYDCAQAPQENCTGERADHVLEACEHQLRLGNRPTAAIFDRHKLLRIKLDTSKKLLEYLETDKERECLVVRATLSELYHIHHRHCYHAVITRCLCERLDFRRLCGIECSQLEPSGPMDGALSWADFRGALVQLPKTAVLPSSLLISTLIAIALL